MADSGSHSDDSNETREFVLLLGKHETQLRAFVLSLVPNWDDADDILQETRLRLWDQFKDYDRSKDFGGWSRAIAHYQVLTMREKRSRHPAFLRQELLDTIAASYDENAEQFDRRSNAMEICLGRFDHVKRELLMRYYTGKETMGDIAQKTGRSLESVKSSIRRMRIKLADCIEQQLK